MYDELNLDEEEEKFGLVNDGERESDESEDESEGPFSMLLIHFIFVSLCVEDLPPRTPSKKHDEESVSSSKRDESPILKKAGVTLQLRSELRDLSVIWPCNRRVCFSSLCRTLNGSRRYISIILFPDSRSQSNIAQSTEATSKSEFCTTAHVKYSQGRPSRLGVTYNITSTSSSTTTNTILSSSSSRCHPVDERAVCGCQHNNTYVTSGHITTGCHRGEAITTDLENHQPGDAQCCSQLAKPDTSVNE